MLTFILVHLKNEHRVNLTFFGTRSGAFETHPHHRTTRACCGFATGKDSITPRPPIHSAFEGRVGNSQSLVIMNKASVSTHVKVLVPT